MSFKTVRREGPYTFHPPNAKEFLVETGVLWLKHRPAVACRLSIGRPGVRVCGLTVATPWLDGSQSRTNVGRLTKRARSMSTAGGRKC